MDVKCCETVQCCRDYLGQSALIKPLIYHTLVQKRGNCFDLITCNTGKRNECEGEGKEITTQHRMRLKEDILYSGDFTIERKCYLTVFLIMAYSVTW